MKPVIVADSSCDLTPEMAERSGIRLVPFTLMSNGHEYIDDETMDIRAFLEDVDASEEITKSAAMSPQHFIDAVGDAAEAFLVTITSHLSSTFNNASIAARELCEMGKKVHVFNTNSASAGETSFAMRLVELIEKGLSFEEIVAEEEHIAETNVTYFILNDYSTLIKSGRIPRMAGRILTGLSIRPVCRGVNGEIGIKSIARGMENAVRKLADHVRQESVNFEERTLYITHIQDLLRANQVKDAILALAPFRKVEIMEGHGLNAAYANRGGIVIGF